VQVLRTFVLNNWQSLVDTKVVTLPADVAPSADAVLAALVNLRAQQGQTALMTACVEGHFEVVELLLSMVGGWAGWMQPESGVVADYLTAAG
jgi:ankyrin repeat protein